MRDNYVMPLPGNVGSKGASVRVRVSRILKQLRQERELILVAIQILTRLAKRSPAIRSRSRKSITASNRKRP